MEGDDEWEDHLIVSYTPPQGCERTLREEQLERIVQNTKLEILQVVDKNSGDGITFFESAKQALPEAVADKIQDMVGAKNLRYKHKYWNFVCRDKRNKGLSLLAAVGSHVFHRNNTGEWTMFPEPGPNGYSGDIRFVLQWKQFDFVFINFEHVPVYQDGQYLKRLAHKFSGNSSFGVQGSDKHVYFLDNDKLYRCAENLESEAYSPEKMAPKQDLVNFDVSASDTCAILFKEYLCISSAEHAKELKFERKIGSGSVRFTSRDRLLTVCKLADESGNQAVLYDWELRTIDTLDLPTETNAMNKMRLLKRPNQPTFVLLNPSTSVVLLLVTSARVIFVDKQDTKDDSYTFACLGNGVLLTGGFSRLICSKVVSKPLKLA